MRTILSLLVCLGLSSCVFMKDNTYASLGGSAAVEFPNGGRLTHSHDASFQVGAQVAGAALAGGMSLSAHKSDNALTGVQTKEAAGVTKAGIEAKKAVDLGGQVPVKSVPPEVVTFPPK